MTGHGTLGADSADPGSPREKRINPKTGFIIAWTTQVSRDSRLLPGSYRLAPRIAQNLWPREEYDGRFVLNKNQKFFRDDLGVSRTSIQNWFNDLVRRGHLEVVVRKGEGKNNDYMPLLNSIPRSAAISATEVHKTRDTAEGETTPPGKTDVTMPADSLHLTDDAATPISLETSMTEVEAVVDRLADDIAWLRANDEVGRVWLSDPESLALSAEINTRECQFDELVALLSEVFPPSKGVDLSLGIRDSLVAMVVHCGEDPAQIIRDARDYVRVTEANEDKLMKPYFWTIKRALVSWKRAAIAS